MITCLTHLFIIYAISDFLNIWFVSCCLCLLTFMWTGFYLYTIYTIVSLSLVNMFLKAAPPIPPLTVKMSRRALLLFIAPPWLHVHWQMDTWERSWIASWFSAAIPMWEKSSTGYEACCSYAILLRGQTVITCHWMLSVMPGLLPNNHLNTPLSLTRLLLELSNFHP